MSGRGELLVRSELWMSLHCLGPCDEKVLLRAVECNVLPEIFPLVFLCHLGQDEFIVVVGVVVTFDHWEKSSKSCKVSLDAGSHVDWRCHLCLSGDCCSVMDCLDTKS
jgi:hypothetical protein